MIVNQILMAAARGARIQERYGYNQPVWETSPVLISDPSEKQRVHPKDAHLRFGPISLAMYEVVKYASTSYKAQFPISDNEYAAAAWFLADPRGKITYMDWRASNELTRDLYLLLMAEVFLEEGI